MTDEILREKQVLVVTKLARTTRWRLENQRKFPARRQLSENAVGWLRSEIEAWLASRKPVAGK
ncbi:MAG: AlpA family phage regulatory protein [Candidatus Hydrogenedentes bacterium]|nr:AlpA family phage regulatory protein [Candidatus Hydrogenedentota bacterium]